MNRTALSLFVLAAATAPGAAIAQPAIPGEILFESRLRYEAVDQADRPLGADALTLRTRLGWQSPQVSDFRFLAELENVTALVDDYSDPVDPDPRRPTVADPEITELNRVQVTWTGLPRTEIVAGRQRIILGNARYMGNVGWRQNEQTFDGVKLVTSALDPVTLSYAWIGQVNRPLGRDHPQGVWTGDVHAAVLEGETPAGRLSGYGYLIDLEEAPTQSSATFGARLAGGRPIVAATSATWELEYARQGDYGDNPTAFDLDYRLVAGGLKGERWSAALVYERLEGDGAVGFRTPLATLHAFQGWADVIGAAPPDGVRDLYLRGQAAVPLGTRAVTLKLEAHDFRDSDGEVRYGRELDVAAALPLAKGWSVELKGARFRGDHPAYPDTTKGWLSLEYRY